MRKIVYIYSLVFIVLFAGDPIKFTENQDIKKSVYKEEKKVIIVFNEVTTENILQLKYDYKMVLKRCMTKRMCLFEIDGLSKKLKQTLNFLPFIKEVIPYQKYQFIMY